MDKVIRNGKVAVLVSYGYGAGWFSWNREYPELLFSPEIVRIIEEGNLHSISLSTVEDLLALDIYLGGFRDLKIVWVEQGSVFRIDEYDGSENLVIQADDDWVMA